MVIPEAIELLAINRPKNQNKQNYPVISFCFASDEESDIYTSLQRISAAREEAKKFPYEEVIITVHETE